MSDEVNALIAARTHELVEARDEISSSIRYAARLQNALLPKSFPEILLSMWNGGRETLWEVTYIS